MLGMDRTAHDLYIFALLVVKHRGEFCNGSQIRTNHERCPLITITGNPTISNTAFNTAARSVGITDDDAIATIVAAADRRTSPHRAWLEGLLF